MTPHFFLLLCAILSQCSTGDTKRDGNNKLGDRCDKTCGGGFNLVCVKKKCECHKDYPLTVQTNIKTLCLKPAKLSEDCLHSEACLATDPNSDCTQLDQVAKCKCKTDYNEIFDKNTQSSRCVLEAHFSTDLATLLGVGAGMTLFCGLTCLVLRIFARARFGPRHHHYANAHLAPPITLSTDHDGERGGMASRHSSQRSSQGGSRRASMLAPPTRPEGSRRASNSSIRSTSSARSFSLKQHSNHHHYHHHRPSDPETHAGLNLNSLSLSTSHCQPHSDTNISPSGHSISQHNSQNTKAKRSGSAGAI